jgi:hypothetical protein
MKRLIRIGGVAVTAAVLASVAIAGHAASAAPTQSGTTPTPQAAACDRTAWEAAVQGRPSFKAGDKGGDYLWHDTSGFHLRVTHATHSRVLYTGEITASAPMRLTPVKLEKGDYVRLSANHRTIVFGFANHGYVDGVNFHTDCAAALTVSHLNRGSTKLPVSEVYLGEHKVHPHHIPFTVHRHKAA